MGRNVGWLGLVLYAVSWFVPVMKGQDSMGALQGMAEESGGEDSPFGGPPGWQACRFAWGLLKGESEQGQVSNGWKARVCGSTCLTNAVMVVAILALLFRKARSTGLALLAFGCTALNLSWIYLGEGDGTSMLAVGYYLWTGSFLLVAMGLTASRE